MRYLIALGTACLGLAVSPWIKAAEPPAVTIVYGPKLTSEGGNGKPGDSKLKSPFGVDFDSHGNMIIAELYGGRIHQLTQDGTLTQIAGDGSKSYKGDGGPLRQATFNGMHNVAIGPDDTLYIADSWNHCIRMVNPKTGIISTLTGNGKAGFSGDNGPARDATYHNVMCITPNPAWDKLHIADIRNRRIRELDLKSNTVRTVAGNGRKGIPKDGTLATASPLVDPRAAAADSKGNLYVLERGGHALRVVRPDGRIYTVAGTGKAGAKDGPGLQAQLNSPKHLCVDHKDRVIIADDSNALIRLYDPGKKTLTRIMGRGHSRPPMNLNKPHGVCYDKGWLYVVDTSHNRILKTPWK